jgi:hypothetical protein
MRPLVVDWREERGSEADPFEAFDASGHLGV